MIKWVTLSLSCLPVTWDSVCHVEDSVTRTMFSLICVLQPKKRFLGALVKWQKATISFVMSVLPSVLAEQLGSNWMDFHEIWYLVIFRKSVKEIQVSLKLGKNKLYFTRRTVYIFCILYISDHTSRAYFYNEKYFRQNRIENQNTHFIFNNFFQKSCRLWDNVEKIF